MESMCYLDPEIHMLLHEINFNPRVRISSRVDEPVIEDNITVEIQG